MADTAIINDDVTPRTDMQDATSYPENPVYFNQNNGEPLPIGTIECVRNHAGVML